ncbi:alginate export family protein [Dyadobacter sp. CY323]|uniref:alginate export family protein n=1 Tax=Dyadobacter sp. CY323 TaxID=2907302 RepID=UPI001F359B7C|nr:alginate export family protein [Dyadobacter sp. CY323]MCE6989669.1 alginate export family protein [Dyadobacter sp. CY323]
MVDGQFDDRPLTIGFSDRSSQTFTPVRYFLFPVLFLALANHTSFSQTADSLKRELTVDFEMRPRAEFRDNFMLAASDSVMPEFFVSQRNRFDITYTSNRFKFHASPQEIHVWGKSGSFSRVGNINAFELYIEPHLTRHLSVRIGRQALSLDNGRIFSAAPWSQQSRAHEGIRLLFNKKVNTDLTIAFTRPYGKRFDAAYSPVASHQYKFLFVHHLKHQLNKHFALTTINTLEVFEKSIAPTQHYQRITNGGRLEFTHSGLYATVNAYYQYGRNAAEKKIRAYYIQPEISAGFEKMTVRLGAEVLSGNKATIRPDVTNSFVPLYGVAWKFMGNMNLFTRFPADVNDKGLMNPYLFALYQVSKKLSLRADAHLFYSQYPLEEPGKYPKGRYLGFESDISLNFKPIKQVEIIYGFSSTWAAERMELLKKVPDSDKIPVWSYLMISFRPRLLRLAKTTLD